MRKLFLAMLVTFVAVAGQVSTATAQSGGKKMTPESSMKVEPMSRAFTNGFNVPSTGLALEGYCPVCYLSANKAVKGSPDFPHEYNGVTYLFVNDDARQAFIKTPEKFLPAYGGWCAVGVSMGQRFPVDPTNFKIVNGRIMLFLKNANVDGVEIWNQDEAGNLGKADTNWTKLKG